MSKSIVSASAKVLVLSLGSPAVADIIMTVEQVGTDVVISGGGSVDLSLAVGNSSFSFEPGAGFNFVIAGAQAPTLIRNLQGSMTGPTTIPGPTPGIFADDATGDMFGIDWDAGTRNVLVPVGYVDGTQLQGSMTFFDQTIESMGFVPGASYTWTWDTNTGTDSFIYTIVPAPSGVMLAVGASAFCLRRRRPGGSDR